MSGNGNCLVKRTMELADCEDASLFPLAKKPHRCHG
jgi:hypothetical protein